MLRCWEGRNGVSTLTNILLMKDGCPFRGVGVDECAKYKALENESY